jgi:hypothetical protein
MMDLSAPRKIAAELAIERVDVNELEKLLAYYRRVHNDKKFRMIIWRLAVQNIFVYSKQTKQYMKKVQSVVLPILPNQPNEALWFLGWTIRFMRYFNEHQDEARTLIGKERVQSIAVNMSQKQRGGRR